MQIEGRDESTEEVAVAEAVGPLAGGTNFLEEKAKGEDGECCRGGGQGSPCHAFCSCRDPLLSLGRDHSDWGRERKGKN